MINCGIYKIKNKINNKCYYGSSKDIDIRFIQHKTHLNNNTHPNIILQRSWNKYGEDSFLFEIVEECDLTNLLIVEQKYLDLNPEYNIAKKSLGGDNLTNHPNRLDIIKRIKKTTQQRFDNMTKEEKQLKFGKNLDENPNWKGGITKQTTCKCGKTKYYGSKNCSDCSLKNRKGENNSFYGKTHSYETLEKLRQYRLGKDQNYTNKPFYINDIEYRSIKDASDKLHINGATIHHRLNSKNYKYRNYRYKGIDKVYYSLEEQKERQSKPHKGKQLNHSNNPFYIDNIEYRTLKEASDKLNIPVPTISSRLKNVNKSNYQYKN